MSYTPQSTKLEQDQQIVVGIDEELQEMTDLRIGGESFTPNSLAELIESRVDAANELIAARSRLQSAIKDYGAIDARVNPIVVDLRTLVFALFGAKSVQAGRFGFSPPKEPRKLTREEASARSARSAATRRAMAAARQRARLGSAAK